MNNHSSEIDSAVAKIRANTAHDFEEMKIGEILINVCKHCGRKSNDVSADNIVRPCRGFI